MAEAVIDPIEQRILQREQNIRELENQVSILTEIEYLQGYNQEAASVPILEKLKAKVKFAFSWGKKSKNMSSKYLDISNPQNSETAEGNKENVSKFLEEHIGPSQRILHVVGRFDGVQQQLEGVDRGYENPNDQGKPNYDVNEVKANFVVTQDPEVTLIIRPADCPVIVVYAKDKNGKPLVVIDHCGREALNAGMTRQGMFYLEENYGVDLSTVTVAILPGMAKENFFITDDLLADGSYRWGNSLVERNWGPYVDPKNDDKTKDKKLGIERNEAGYQKRHIDMTRAAIMQLLQAGIDPKNIQAYDVDSFAAAQKGESYSHRLTNDYGGKRPGRFMAAVKLEDFAEEMPIAA